MLHDILEENADEASFLWRMRQQALGDWLYDLNGLADLDNRLNAHLDGLLIAGIESTEICTELFDDWDGGECFVMTHALVRSSDEPSLLNFIADHAVSADALAGIVAALAWSNWGQVAVVLQRLMSAGQPALEKLALQAATQHRADIGSFLERYLASDESACRAAAMDYAGICGKLEALPSCRDALALEDPELQRSAAMACFLLGDGSGLDLLRAQAETLGEEAFHAGAAAASGMAPGPATVWLESLITGEDTERLGLRLAGICGYKSLAPVLLQAMREPKLARLAFAAFHHAYGVDYEAEYLQAIEPPDVDPQPGDDADAPLGLSNDDGLPWPDVHALTSWWLANQERFADNQRFLLGVPIDDAQLLLQLKRARQPIRCAAAFEAAARVPARAVFNANAPAARQRGTLGA